MGLRGYVPDLVYVPLGRVARQRPKPIDCQGGGKSWPVSSVQLTQPRCTTDVPDWVTNSAVQPTVCDSDRFNFKSHGRQLAPSKCNLGGRSVWEVVVQPFPSGEMAPNVAVPAHRLRGLVVCQEGVGGAELGRS